MVAAVLIAAVPAVAEVVVPRVGFIELRRDHGVGSSDLFSN